jgi:hypothetical protein
MPSRKKVLRPYNYDTGQPRSVHLATSVAGRSFLLLGQSLADAALIVMSRAHGCNILHPDLRNSGGFLETRQIADIANAFGLPIDKPVSGAELNPGVVKAHLAPGEPQWSYPQLRNIRSHESLYEQHSGGNADCHRRWCWRMVVGPR